MANTDRITALLDREIARKVSDRPSRPFMRFANYKYESTLKKAGETITVPIMPKINLTDVSSQNSWNIRLTSEQDIAASDRNPTTSQLTINKLHEYREVYSDLEEIQTLYSINGERIKDLVNGMEEALETSIIQMLDAHFLTTIGSPQVVTATTLNVNNCVNILMKVATKMSKKSLPRKWRIGIVSPEVASVLVQAKVLSNTESGVNAAVEGYIGRLAGFDLFESTHITTGNCYFFMTGSYNYVRQLYKAKVTEAEKGMYYNILAQIAHGGKVFDQNAEQVYKLEITTVDVDTYTPEVKTVS